MVSPLSSRILNAEAQAKIAIYYPPVNNPLAVNVIEDWQQRAKSNKRVSGYSADRSDHEILPSRFCSLDKAVRAQQVGNHAKRRRTEEASFQAFNARSDLANSGVNCLPGLIGRSRALPHGSFNMNEVKLIVVSRNNPYEDDIEPIESVNKTNDISSNEDYMQLISCSQHFYTTMGRVPTPSVEAANERSNNENASNTIGTMNTPTECSSISEGLPNDILPKPQDKGYVQDKETVGASEDMIHRISSSKSSTTITLEDALAPSETARLILEGTVSFSIVHSNAAFSRLTGIASNEIVGNSLTDTLDISFLKHKDTQSTFVSLREKKGALDCSTAFDLKTSVVNNNAKTTHVVLDFHIPSGDQISPGGDGTINPVQAIG